MANNIDERIVELQFDNKQFESGVKDTIKSLDDLKKGLKLEDVTDGFAALDKAATSVNLNPLQNGVEQVSQKFSALEIVAISALNRITNQAMATGETFIKSLTVAPIASGWDKYEQKIASVQKIMNSQADLTMEQVEAALDKINWFTDETSYDFSAMVQTLGSFASSGIELGEATEAVIGLGNAAAISGVNARDANHAFLGFQRAIGSGYLSLGLWNSFLKTAGFQSQAFIKAAMRAGLEVGTLEGSLEDCRTALKGTTVDAGNFANTLNEKWLDRDVIKRLTQNFNIATNELYDIMNPPDGSDPKYDSLNEAIRKIGDTLDQESLKALKAGQETKTWGDTVEYVRESVTQGWSKTFELIFGNYEEATKFFSTIVEEMGKLFVSAGENRNEFLAEWKELGGRNSFINGLINSSRILNAIITNIREAFARVIPPVAVESAVKLTAAFERATVSIAEALGIDNIADSLKKEVDEVTEGLEGADGAAKGLGGTMKTIAEMAQLVIRGDYGNGAARKTALEELGYSYETVQNKVNELLGCSFRYTAMSEEEADAAMALANANSDASQSLEEEAKVVVDVNNTILNLSSTFKGLVAIAELIAYAIGSVARVGARIFKYVFKLGDGILGLTGSLGDLIVSVKDFIIENDILYTILNGLADLIGGVLSPIINVFTSLMDALSSRQNPISEFIGKLIDGLATLTSIDFAPIFKKAFDTVNTAIQNFITKISDGIKNVISFVSQIEIVQTIAMAIGGAFLGAATGIKTLWNTLKKGPATAFSSIKNFYNQTVSWIKSVEFPSLNLNFETFINAIKDFGKNDIIEPAIRAFTFISEKAKEFGSVLVEGVRYIIDFAKQNNLLEMALKGLLLVVAAIPLGIIAIWNAVKDAPVAVFNFVKDFFDKLGDQLKDLNLPDVRKQFKDLWTTVKDFAKNTVIPSITNAFGGFSTSLAAFVAAIVKGASAVAKFVKESDILGMAFRFFQPYVTKVSERLKNLWQSIITSGPKIVSSVKNVFGIVKKWFDRFQLSRLQWSFDDFWRSFLPADNILVKLNDFKRYGITGLFQGIGIFKNVGRELSVYYQAISDIIKDYAKDNKFIEGIGKALEWIKNSVIKVFNYLKGVAAPTLEKIKDTLKPFTDKLKAFWSTLKSIDYKLIYQYVGALLAIVGVFTALKTAYNVSRFLAGFANIGDAISDFFSAIKIKAIGQTALNFAFAVGIICGVAYLVSKMEWDEVIRGFGAVAIIAALMIGAMLSFSAIAKHDPKSILAATGAITAVAFAIGAVVASMVFLKDMDKTDYWNALLKVAGIILALIVTMLTISWLMKGKAIDLKSMAGLYIFAMTLSKVASLISEISEMPLEKMKKGIGGLLGIAIILGTVALAISGLSFKNTISLVVMAGGLWLFTQVVKSIANEDFEKITVGILKMLPMVAALKLVSSAGKSVGNGGLQTAALLFSLALSVKMIAKVIKDLGRIPREELIKGGVAVTIIMGVLVFAARKLAGSAGALGFFSNAGKGSAGAMIAFAAAVWVCASAIKMLAEIKDPAKAIVAAASLALIIAVLGKAMNWAFVFANGKAIASIIAFIAVIITVVGALFVMQMLDMEKLKRTAIALGGIILSIGLSIGAASLTSIGSLAAVLAAIGLLIVIVVELKSLQEVGNIKEIADALTEVVGVITALSLVIGVVSALNQGSSLHTFLNLTATGGGLALAIGVIEGILVGITTLIAKYLLGGKDHDLTTGLDNMVTVFSKLGEAVGALGGGTVSGYADALGDSGKKLSQFATDADTFGTTMGGTKWANYVTSMSDFTRCIKTLNSVKPDPQNFTNYGAIMFSLGTGAKNLMSALETANFDFTKFTEFATAIPQITEVLKDPVKVDPQYWDNFNESMTNLGNALVDFSTIVNGENAIDPTGFSNAQTAVNKLVGIAEKIKSLGTFYGFDTILGEADSEGANSLIRLGNGLKEFSKLVGPEGGEGSVDIDRLLDSFEAIRRLAVAASKVPTIDTSAFGGNIAANIPGFGFDIGLNNSKQSQFSWDTLTSGLTELASALVTFSTTSKDIDDDGLSKGLSAVDQLSVMAQNLPVSFTSDLKKFIFKDDKSMGGFAEALEQLAGAIVIFHDKLSPLDATELTPSFQLLDKIINMPRNFQRAGLDLIGDGVSDSLLILGDALVNFASQFVQACNILHEAATSLGTTEDDGSTFADQMNTLFTSFFGFMNEDNLAKIEAAGQLISQHLSTGVNSDTTYIVAAASQYLTNFVHELESDVAVTALYESGKKLAENLCKGFNGQESRGKAEEAVNSLATKISTAFYTKTVYDMMYKAGGHLVDGLVAGIKDATGKAEAAAAALANAVNSQFTGIEQVNSPSKVWIKYGGSLIEGLVKGLDKDTSIAENAVGDLAYGINSVMEDSSLSPTITPVVDLSTASLTAGRINTMFDSSRAAALNASMEINSQVSQMDSLVDMTSRILGTIQNGSDLYLDDSILAGRINRRLGVL